jgi:hypothetical protein
MQITWGDRHMKTPVFLTLALFAARAASASDFTLNRR